MIPFWIELAMGLEGRREGFEESVDGGCAWPPPMLLRSLPAPSLGSPSGPGTARLRWTCLPIAHFHTFPTPLPCRRISAHPV